ncbi:MAG: NrfD/PsrC family molybdoenzyme membrane anchor subunit, partial [Solirubrobacteraceae bacterium]
MSDPQAAISQMGGRGRHQGRDGAMVPAATPDSYYGRPVLTAPVWTWEIAAYFFTGGLAGASATLAAGAGLTGNATLARRAWPVALAGAAVSPVLLISDLGRPERFLRMLRVFKPTSPMSVGTWVLSAFATATGLATDWQLLGVPPAAVGVPAAAVAALTGPVVSTYT